jgi:hypothetical protein
MKRQPVKRAVSVRDAELRALLDGPPRLVAEDKDRVAILFSTRKSGLRLCLESVRALRPLLDELRTKVPELEPYPLPPDFYCWLGGTSIRVTSDPSKLPAPKRGRPGSR